MTIGFIRILIRHMAVFRRTWRSNVMFSFIEPLLYLGALGYGLGVFVEEMEGMSYIQFIAPGIAASSTMFATTFECTYGTFLRLHHERTFQAMLCTPVTVWDAVIADILFGALKGALFGAVILFVITLMGLNQSILSLFIPLFLILPGLVFAAFAMCFTGITPIIDNFNYYITLFITPLYLFSGIFFPVGSMPPFMQKIIILNPIYHSAEVCRALTMGNVFWQLWVHVGVLVLLSLIFIPMSVRLIRKKIIT